MRSACGCGQEVLRTACGSRQGICTWNQGWSSANRKNAFRNLGNAHLLDWFHL
jgi:hypothetical protein